MGGATVEKHIIHSQISSCFACLLRLLRVTLWFLKPCSHFLIGAQWVTSFWYGNRLQVPQPFFFLASAAPFLLERSPVRVVLMPSAIPVIPFLISDYWDPPPLLLQRGPVILPTAREQLSVPPPPISLWRWRHILVVHQLFDRKMSCLCLTAPGIVGKWTCGGGKMVGGKIPKQGGACEESVSVSVCSVYFSLLLECYHDNDKVSYVTCLTSITNW